MDGRDSTIFGFFKRRAAMWVSILLPLIAVDVLGMSVLSWLADWATVPGIIKAMAPRRGPGAGYVHHSPLYANLYVARGQFHVIAEDSVEWQVRDLSHTIDDLPEMEYAGYFSAAYFVRSSGFLTPWRTNHWLELRSEEYDYRVPDVQTSNVKNLAFRAWLAESRIHTRWRAAANNGAQGLPAESSEWHVVGILHDVLMVFCIILAIRLVPAARDQRRLARQIAATRCQQCGYPRSGLPSATCPECGFTPRSDTEDSKV